MEYRGLLEWLVAHGATVSSIAPAHFPDTGRGVRATADIQRGEELLSVPEPLLMTGRSARADPQLGPALRRLQQQWGMKATPQEELAAHLLHEVSKGRDSFWFAYLRHLPRNFTTLMSFPEAAALQADYAIAAAQAARHTAKQSFGRVQPLIQDLGLQGHWSSEEAWIWALSNLSSRTMFLAPEEPAGALTPLGDLHNYQAPPPPYLPECASPPAFVQPPPLCLVVQRPAPAAWCQQPVHVGVQGCSMLDAATPGSPPANADADEAANVCGDGRFDGDSKAYKLHARRRYSAGDQVFLCYGTHTNLELLEHYGFVLPATLNPHDLAVLPSSCLPAAVVSALAADKRAVHPNGMPTWDLLRELRLAAMSQAERRASGYLAACGERVSAANDAGALALLQDACRAAAQLLPTSLEHDEQLLQQLREDGDDDNGGCACTGERGATNEGVNLLTEEMSRLLTSEGEGMAAAGAICDKECASKKPGLRECEGAVIQTACDACGPFSWQSAADAVCSERQATALAVEWRVGYKRALRASLDLSLEGD